VFSDVLMMLQIGRDVFALFVLLHRSVLYFCTIFVSLQNFSVDFS